MRNKFVQERLKYNFLHITWHGNIAWLRSEQAKVVENAGGYSLQHGLKVNKRYKVYLSVAGIVGYKKNWFDYWPIEKIAFIYTRCHRSVKKSTDFRKLISSIKWILIPLTIFKQFTSIWSAIGRQEDPALR